MSSTVFFDESPTYQFITDELIKWDLTPKYGAGIYFKCEKYGHLAFSVCGSTAMQDSISWNRVQGILPEAYQTHVDVINATFLQFAAYVRRVRNEAVYLSFELVDISYHPVDYRDIAYILAANRAILNCFSHPDFAFDASRTLRH